MPSRSRRWAEASERDSCSRRGTAKSTVTPTGTASR
jgi:hypothetical protein